jgi:hypothetical protein
MVMMTARKMAQMAEHVPERTGNSTDHALRRKLCITRIGQRDRRRQYRSEKDGAPAHAHFATIRMMVGT